MLHKEKECLRRGIAFVLVGTTDAAENSCFHNMAFIIKSPHLLEGALLLHYVSC